MALESPHSRKRRLLTWLLIASLAMLLCALCLTACALGAGGLKPLFAGLRLILVGEPEVLKKYESITPGMPHPRVLELLGRPTKSSPGGASPDEYRVILISRRDEPTRVAPQGGVLTYVSPQETSVCYVYLDEDDRVVDVHIVVWDD